MKLKNLLAGLTVVLAMASCQKENPVPFVQSDDSYVFSTREGGAKYDDKACTVYDGNGQAICAGQRCGSPNGTKCKSETSCACVARSGNATDFVYEKMTLEQFNAMLQDPEGRKTLESKGIYSKDN